MTFGVFSFIQPRQQSGRKNSHFYQVVFRTETTAQLIRKKKLSAGKTLAFGALYLVHHASKKDSTAFVSVNPDGSYQVINENGNSRTFDAGQRITYI